jgi:hypothetical protein
MGRRSVEIPFTRPALAHARRREPDRDDAAGGEPIELTVADPVGPDGLMTSQAVRMLEAKGLLERPVDASDTRAGGSR